MRPPYRMNWRPYRDNSRRARCNRRAAYASPYRVTLGGNIGAMPNLASLAAWLVSNGQKRT